MKCQVCSKPATVHLTNLVNGRKLVAGQKQALLDGDEVVLGQGTYRFETAGPAEAPAPFEGVPTSEPPVGGATE